MASLGKKLFNPVDNSPLILFRVGFGLLIMLEAWGAIATGWVKKSFIIPEVTFPFIGFEWLQPLPGQGMYVYYFFMGMAGLSVMLGFYYRVSVSIYAVLWTASYLMQKTNYNNHYYLLVLLCVIMIIMPANAYLSFDAKRNPKTRALTCPQWCIWVFMFQVSIVYIYASIAKMYPDWLAAKPVSIWFTSKSEWPLIGPVLAKSWVHWAVSYCGIAFDLLIAPGLLWKKTRKWAFGLAIFFHLFNSAIFHIGIFPYMGILLCIFFFPAETSRKIYLSIRRGLNKIGIKLADKPKPDFQSASSAKANPLLVYGLVIWFALQVGLPLRPWFYPGNPNWTEEGHRLSWHMMLRVKSGFVNFSITNMDTDSTWVLKPKEILTNKQSRAIASRPDMCWQFVQHLKSKYAKEGKPNIAIYAKGKVSLNGGKYYSLYNPDIDLASVAWEPFSHSNWLLPLPKKGAISN